MVSDCKHGTPDTVSCPWCEVERLKAETHDLRGLLETALDYFESAPGPHVSLSWRKRVNEIVEKGGDDAD